MIINTLQLTDQFNKSGRTNQHAKPPFEGVSSVWRINHTTKLTFQNGEVNHPGATKTDCLVALINLNDIWRNRERSPILKPERYTYGQKGLADINAIPHPQKTNRAKFK
jgi:hypothetical protein